MVAHLTRRLTTHRSFEAGLGALVVLNLADALFTLGWVEVGLATEANPVMAGAMTLGPGLFVLSKVALVTLATTLLYRNRSLLTARLALVPLALLYAFVGGGHVGFALYQGMKLAPALLLG
jgi:hypothetical protein